MQKRLYVAVGAVLCVAALIPATSTAKQPAKTPPQAVTTFATGLNSPRGLTFGPNGDLYVAEGGVGGSLTTTAAQCQQVPSPIGPYSGGFTARISEINKKGVRSTVADRLPSSKTATGPGSFAEGVADVAFIDHTLYALEAGASCSHGLKDTVNSVLRVNQKTGTIKQVADLSRFLKTHPVAKPEAEDFEPDGTWYSMVAVRGQLYAVEPNHGEIDRINPRTGKITRLVDVSATQGHIVPTALAYNGNFFFGNLGTFPIVPGREQVRKLTPSGKIKTWAGNLTTVLGLTFGPHHRLYVLESMTKGGVPDASEAGTGRVVQIDPSGKRTVTATGLSFPTAMTLGPDGALYVSNLGFGVSTGQILRITIPQ